MAGVVVAIVLTHLFCCRPSQIMTTTRIGLWHGHDERRTDVSKNKIRIIQDP